MISDSDLEKLGVFASAAFVYVLLTAWWQHATTKNAHRLLRRWADLGGFEILGVERAKVAGFPPLWPNQRAFEISVATPDGKKRTGTAICGRQFLAGPDVIVEWSEPCSAR